MWLVQRCRNILNLYSIPIKLLTFWFSSFSFLLFSITTDLSLSQLIQDIQTCENAAREESIVIDSAEESITTVARMESIETVAREESIATDSAESIATVSMEVRI